MNANSLPRTPATARDQRLIEEVLAKTSLLRGISDIQLAALARHSWSVEAKRGATVFAPGYRLPGLYAVAYGMVKVGLRRRSRGERVLRLVNAHDTFGEPVALLGRPAAYDAQALADSRLVVVPSAALYGLIDADPRAARQLVMALAMRTLDLLSEIESSTLRPTAPRLASYLAALAADAGAPVVRLPASKTVVAARLGMKKETLSRLLRRFAAQGLIEVHGREVALLDAEGLARLHAPAG